ncbi:hypothetical protein ABPG75_003577 [Micractinium tetrahymenae]
MVLLLSDLLLPVLQAVAYAALGLCVRMHAALRALAALCALAAAQLAVAAPALHPLLAALVALPPREHVGSRPRPPTVLGVAVAEQIEDDQWPAAVEALGRLLAWAHDRGFRLVLIHEPGGHHKQGPVLRQLELQLLQRRLHSTVRLQAGWQQPSEAACPGQMHPGGMGAEEAGYGRDLRVVLLAAGDGEWPLLAAAAAGTTAAAAGPGGLPCGAKPQWRQHGEAASNGAAALDAAVAAPARVRQRLAAAAGPLGAAEPDFVLVTGPALTLAGFPAWMVRASEMYGIGPLAGLQGTAELEGALRRFCGTKQRWGK